jgi:hypothetical protein
VAYETTLRALKENDQKLDPMRQKWARTVRSVMLTLTAIRERRALDETEQRMHDELVGKALSGHTKPESRAAQPAPRTAGSD